MLCRWQWQFRTMSMAILVTATTMLLGCDDPVEDREQESAEEESEVADDESQAEDEEAEASAQEEPTLEAATDEITGLDDDGERPEWLARTWQSEKFGVGSGLLATYHFFDDGLFVFNSGSSDSCEPGVRARVGSWELDGDELVLSEQRRIEEFGGEKVDDPTLGCVLEDSTQEVTIFDEPRQERLEIADCSDDELEEHASEIEELGVECRKFSGDVHWTVAAGADSWRQDWKDWMATALDQ